MNISRDLIEITGKLMALKSQRDIVALAGEMTEIIDKAIEAENAGAWSAPESMDFSLSAQIKFKHSEIEKMSATFKKEFISNGLVARIIKRPSGKKGYYYEIRYRRNGYNITASSTDLKEAKQKFLKMTEPSEIEKHRAKGVKSGLYLLDEVVEEWLEYKRGKVVNQTWTYYKSAYARYISPMLGNKPVPVIKTLDVDKILSNVSGRLYEDLRSLFSQIFRYCVNSGIISHNPILMIPFRRAERVSHEALSEEEVRRLLVAVEEPAYAPYKQAFLIMLYFGLRPCELADARFEGDFLIARNAKRKNGKIEYKKIPVSDMIRGKIDTNSVITMPATTNGMNRVFRRIFADMEHTQYSLRHTFATVCQQYVRPDIVDIWMGDSSERLVGRVYTHFPDSFMREQMKAVIFAV